MSFKKKLSAALMSLALVSGGAVVGASPANAGTSIGSTYNGASHIYYKFYASTNEFCIKKTYGSSYTANVLLYADGSHLVTLATSAKDKWFCKDLDKFGKVEGKRIKFKLTMLRSNGSQAFRSSIGYASA